MSESWSAASRELSRAFSLNQVVPNAGFFEDQFTANFHDLQFNNRPVERLDRLLSEITPAQTPGQEVPVFDDSNLTIKNKVLGRGAEAVVYAATHKKDRITHEVAVKVPMSAKNALAEKALKMRHVKQQIFELKHPKFVEYYGIYIDPSDQKPCIVMQQLKGHSLAYHLKLHYEDMSLKSKINIARQIAEALQFAHSKSILLTDLKPDNILFVEVPDLKNNANINICVIDVTEGDYTVPYSSLEGLAKNFSEQTDIYTFGVIVWQIFSGRKPYGECGHECQIAFKIYKNEKLEIPSAVPADIKSLIESCWRTPCHMSMDAVVAILKDVEKNAETIEYTTTCPIPVGLF